MEGEKSNGGLEYHLGSELVDFIPTKSCKVLTPDLALSMELRAMGFPRAMGLSPKAPR